MTSHRIGVIGAGIVGLSVARHLALSQPGTEVTVLEKETAVASHQTGHNSGVAHAGLYYTPGSLKARLCRRGVELLEKFCAEHDVPFDACGKLVVARGAHELGRLDDIEQRARANGVPGLRRVDADGIREIEPYATGLAALHSPRSAILDYRVVAEAMADDLRTAGGRVLLGAEVKAVRRTPSAVVVTVATGEEHEFDQLVICAGLYADRVSRLAGDEVGPAIVPFRGEYYRLAPEKAALVRGLIYPVPDPTLPFLGIHITRGIDGTVEIGPNAVLAFAREGYRRGKVVPDELWATLRWPGFWRLAQKHWKTGAKEMYGSLSARSFIAEARTYMPALSTADVVPTEAGVRAQAVDANGAMVDDFRINHVGRVVTVRNAPSPAATSSLAIGEYVAEKVVAARTGR